MYRFTGSFPDGTLGAASEKVEFEELLGVPATRVVVISPGSRDRGLPVGRRADGPAQGQLQRRLDRLARHRARRRQQGHRSRAVRDLLGVPRSRVLAIGDGRNDIDMLEWASDEGPRCRDGPGSGGGARGRHELTGTDLDDGAAVILNAFSG